MATKTAVDRRPLEASGLEVPVVGMGTWRTFDSEEDRGPIVEAALAAGIDLFDTSPMYGRAEEVLGAALQGLRERVLVADKIWTESRAEGRVQAQKALGLYSRVDVYQVHNLVAWPTQLELLEMLRDQGRVRVLGATHYQPSAFGELARVMRSGRIGMIQIPYGPNLREAEREILPLAAELGLGVFVMSPLQHGILDRDPGPERLAELGAASWPELIVRWILSDDRIATVLTATRSPAHLAQTSAGGRGPWLTPKQREAVAKLT